MPKKKTTKGNAEIQSNGSAGHVHPAQSGDAEDASRNRFPVVGLGASAGGLEALKSFFAEVTRDSGLAYIVNVHMTPKQPSLMPELLQRVTRVPVATAADGQPVEPDHIYVAPSDKIVDLRNGIIHLLDIGEKRPTLSINFLLKSLARDQGPAAVAIILSGTGSDGTLGVKEIKANDGLVMVQSADSAAYDGMPRSAIGTRVADMILRPEEMPNRLIQYFANTYTALSYTSTSGTGHDRQDWLNQIFALLRARIGHDFSEYKVNTLLRRICRRMSLNQIEDHDRYLHFLRQNPVEVDALFRELLIGVTSFFRDPDSFELLKNRIIPDLLQQIPEGGTFRAWIPGCSTGEEVYSLGIAIREVLNDNAKRINLQLFGTDIDNFAIDKAREGLYPASVVTEVGGERLQRFFVKEGEMYRIRKEIRDCAVFSVQDLIKDPPFSRLHLLCCRNLLIYLGPVAQKRLMPLFHYTLLPDGVLMLGASESIGGFSNLFDPLNNKWKIFKRREVPQALRRQVDFPSGLASVETSSSADIALPPPAGRRIDIGQMTRQLILTQYSPAALLVDRKGLILYVQGRTGKYLETPSGVPTNNVLDMARVGLSIELSAALRLAKSSGQPVVRRKVDVKDNDTVHRINLHVSPLQSPRELAGRFLVVFEDIEPPAAADTDHPDRLEHEASRLNALERELIDTRESHQTLIEELESTNEELKSTNEEMQSANEELQSTNEELESSREELQSLNEELQTVNAELQNKVDDLDLAHDDMRNLLNSTEIATIFVDNDGCIRRFTPEATAIVNLIQADIGRPLQHVVSNLSYQGMIADLSEVLRTLTPREHEVGGKDGRWYKMRIIPYRTTDHRIAGAVLTFASIDEQKQAQQVLRAANLQMEGTWYLVRSVFDVMPNPLAVLDNDGRIVIANTAFAKVANISSEKIQGMAASGILNSLMANTPLPAKLQEAMEKNENFRFGKTEIPQLAELGIDSVDGQILHTGEALPYRILLRFMPEE